MGYIIGIASLIIYFLIIYRAIKISGFEGLSISNKDRILSFFICLIFLTIFVGFLSKEQYLPWGDYGNYWYKTLVFSEKLINSPLKALSTLYHTINNSDYNYFPSLFISIPLEYFGGSFFAYIVILLLLFYIPTIFLLALFLQKIIFIFSYKKIPFYLLFLTVFFPMLFIPTIQGYVGIIVLPLIVTCFYLVINKDFDKLEIEKSLLLSILLIFIILLRRYFAYWCVGFSCWLIIYFAINSIKNKKRIVFRIIELLVIFIACTSFLLVFFNGFLKMSLGNNYSFAYSVYKHGNLLENYWKIILFLGIFQTIIILFASLKELLINKNYLLITLIFNVFITVFLFLTVQSLGMHHYHIIVIQLIILVSVSMIIILSSIKKTIFNKIFSFIFLSIIIINFYFSINITQNTILFTNITILPRIRKDIRTMQNIDFELMELVRSNNIDGVYFTSLNDLFSSDHFVKMHSPKNPIGYNLFFTAHADLRDGFSTDFFKANIIVVTDPGQYSFNNNNNATMRLLNEEFLNENSIISDNFYLHKEFLIANDVHVRIYIKTKNFSNEEILYLRDLYDVLYPQYPELFKNRFDIFILNNN